MISFSPDQTWLAPCLPAGGHSNWSVMSALPTPSQPRPVMTLVVKVVQGLRTCHLLNPKAGTIMTFFLQMMMLMLRKDTDLSGWTPQFVSDGRRV